MRIKLLLFIAISHAFLLGCGQTGSLYLPSETEEVPAGSQVNQLAEEESSPVAEMSKQ